MKNNFATALRVLAGALIASTAAAVDVGVDATNGFDPDATLATGADYDSYRLVLEALGVNIVPINTFTPEALEGLAAVVVNQNYEQNRLLTLEEVVAIRQFYAAGGGLIIHGDAGGGSQERVVRMNQLVAPFGVSISFSSEDGSSREVQGFVQHPLTRGLERIGVDFQRPLTLSQPAFDPTLGDGNDNVMAAISGIPFGFGNAVILSDGSQWTDPDSGSMTPIDFGDNTRWLVNTFLFAVPELRGNSPSFSYIADIVASFSTTSAPAATSAPDGPHGR